MIKKPCYLISGLFYYSLRNNSIINRVAVVPSIETLHSTLTSSCEKLDKDIKQKKKISFIHQSNINIKKKALQEAPFF